MSKRATLSGLLIGAVVIATASTAVPASTTKQTNPQFQPCQTSDLGGTWRLMTFDERPYPGEDTDEYKVVPYQYMFFTDNGSYMFVKSNVEYRKEKNVSALLRLASGEFGLRYSLDKKGMLTVASAKETFGKYSCQVSAMEAGGYKKGDIILTEQVKAPQPGEVIRIYRRMVFSETKQ
jgi:hypothetical protein